MRIISGNFKGFLLYAPKNKNTRPLKDLARESIFNLLEHSNKIDLLLNETNILDLYSGTGSFGLECLSRNSNRVYFVEKDETAFEILEKNIEKLKVKKKSTTFFSDVFSLINKSSIGLPKFDIIFCDPPFKDLNINKLIELIFNKKLLKKEGIIILHRNKNLKDNFPNYFCVLDERIYGISKIIFARILA